MLRNLFEPNTLIVLAKLILNIHILSLIFHHFFSGIYLGNVMSFSTLGKYCQFWDNETTSIFNWKCTTPLFKSWYKSQVIREVILCIGSNLIYLRMGFREFCHRLQVFVSLTTAVALEANISAGVRTAKYAILASTYITVTNGIDIPMARGRFLQNDWQVIEQGITLVSLWSVITQFSVIKNILR